MSCYLDKDQFHILWSLHFLLRNLFLQSVEEDCYTSGPSSGFLHRRLLNRHRNLPKLQIDRSLYLEGNSKKGDVFKKRFKVTLSNLIIVYIKFLKKSLYFSIKKVDESSFLKDLINQFKDFLFFMLVFSIIQTWKLSINSLNLKHE